MYRQTFIILAVVSSCMAQSSFDILNTPTDTRDAALGISLNPIVKPTRILTHPEHQVTLSVWNWVEDIQGAYIGIDMKQAHFSVQAMHSGELELRNEIPSEDPISTFEYTLFNSGGAYAHQFKQFTLGLGAELIYERSLNTSATGLSLNLAAAYALNESIILSGGFRHFGVTGKLDEESTTLPSEIWGELDAEFGSLTLLTEVSNGSFPLASGLSYPLTEGFEFLGGLQIEMADPSVRIHPSAGFTSAWNSFSLGYGIYQIDHRLGLRHFVTLYWSY
ncbi:hypothetical protein HQ531_04610 [bacterium]|nr:hypothetical protein [bacterium]